MSRRREQKKNRQIALFIILIIALYIIVQFFKLINRNDISSYQVKEGSLAVSSVYTGIALREEKIFQCSDTGYINYLAREGEHVANGDLLYIVDEGGALEELLNNGELGENSLSDQDLSNLKTDIISFTSTFDKSDIISCIQWMVLF